jgi:hypothetical protein
MDLQHYRATPLQFLKRRIRLLLDPISQYAASGLVQFKVSTTNLQRRIIASLLDASAPRRADIKALSDLFGLKSFVIKAQHAIFKSLSVSHRCSLRLPGSKRQRKVLQMRYESDEDALIPV